MTIPFFSSPIAHAVTISTSIPGATAPVTAGGAPGAAINTFYQFAIFISGLLAFAIVVYGGVKYMAAAGNPTGQHDAKEWIWAALLGILLLAGAYMILNIINPQLVNNLTLPGLKPVTVTATNAAGGTSGSFNTSPTCVTTANGGSSGTCPNDASGKVQNCCNLYGAAICTTLGCSDPSLKCHLTSNGGTSGGCPNYVTSGGTSVVQSCCNEGGVATCTQGTC